MLERRHYKLICEAAHQYWLEGGPHLREHLIAMFSRFENFSAVRFERHWHLLTDREMDRDLMEDC